MMEKGYGCDSWLPCFLTPYVQMPARGDLHNAIISALMLTGVKAWDDVGF